MARTFTYTFSDPANSSLTVTTGDTSQTVTTNGNGGTGQGFTITSISGTFAGQQVTGLYGPSGAFFRNPDGFFSDNAIFINSSQGRIGGSLNGIDGNGIAFSLSNGNTVHIYLGGTRSNNLAASTVTPTGSDQINTTLQSTNYSTQVCYCTGTHIRVVRAGRETNVAVESLRIGDRAVTVSGAMRPIIWIGHRDLDGRGQALRPSQRPIRVRANAFGPGLPARTLRLSPGHPVLVGADADGEGGHLVPIMCLINGTSITREPVEAVTYWHVELDSHDILLAEGLPAESYYDMGSRVWFAGEDGALSDPDLIPAGEHGRCRPVAVDGPVVEAERLRLDAVFAAELAGHGAWDDADAWLAA